MSITETSFCKIRKLSNSIGQVRMTIESDRTKNGALRREIGPIGVAATTINIVMGSGLFVIPATLGAVGGWAPVIIILCGLIMAAVTLCFAEASSRVPTVGGAYGFVGEALGPVAASVVGGQIWVSGTFAGGAILAAATAQIAPFVPALGSGIGRALLIMLICATFAAIAMRGARESARAIEVTILLKVAPLLLFVAIVAFAPAGPAASPQAFDLIKTAPLLILGIYLFAGLESGNRHFCGNRHRHPACRPTCAWRRSARFGGAVGRGSRPRQQLAWPGDGGDRHYLDARLCRRLGDQHPACHLCFCPRRCAAGGARPCRCAASDAGAGDLAQRRSGRGVGDFG
jgi:hypothetical protein